MSVTSSRRISVTLIVLAIDVPAAIAISARLRSAQSTCSAASPIVPVSRFRPAWPDVYRRWPIRIAWGNGPVGGSRPGAMIGVSDMGGSLGSDLDGHRDDLLPVVARHAVSAGVL